MITIVQFTWFYLKKKTKWLWSEFDWHSTMLIVLIIAWFGLVYWSMYCASIPLKGN